MPDYFERVARRMSRSVAAGTFNSYDTILRRLHEHFKTEAALRAYIAGCEAEVARIDPGADFHFLDDS